MVIYHVPIRERLHTRPADMRPTRGAGDVVAPGRALDMNLAIWAGLDVVRGGPPLEQGLLGLPSLIAQHIVVSLNATMSADAHKTHRTLHKGTLVARAGERAVYLRAIRRRAEGELLWPRADVRGEGAPACVVELRLGKDILRERNGDSGVTFPFVSEAFQREALRHGGGEVLS